MPVPSLINKWWYFWFLFVFQENNVWFRSIEPGEFKYIHFQSIYIPFNARNNFKLESHSFQSKLLDGHPIWIVAEEHTNDFIVPDHYFHGFTRSGFGMLAHFRMIKVLALNVAEYFVRPTDECFITNTAFSVFSFKSFTLHDNMVWSCILKLSRLN